MVTMSTMSTVFAMSTMFSMFVPMTTMLVPMTTIMRTLMTTLVSILMTTLMTTFMLTLMFFRILKVDAIFDIIGNVLLPSRFPILRHGFDTIHSLLLASGLWGKHI
jgi:hypothetical protein